MKKIIILSVLLSIGLSNLQSQNAVKEYTAAPSSGVYQNCKGFNLKPGFSYKATAGKPMSFKADPNVCLPEGQSVGASSDHNYIIAVQPLDATSVATFSDKDVTLDYGVRANISISYFDGLGRPDQTIQRGVTPTKKDLLGLQEYDAFGRESSTWLPVNSTGSSGDYRDINAIKERAKAVYGETRAFNQPVYEASPLNRVIEQYGPGDSWFSNKKRVQTEYLTNNSTNAALTAILYKVGGTRNNPTISKSGNYGNGQLYVTKITHEDGNFAYEFKDKLGQVVLTRQMDGTTPLSTYYVYNDFGNLVYVLPPKANDIGNATLMNQFAYKYKYDNRNRCIEKKLPGAEPIFYVYDKADRLIFCQDGEQRNRKVNGKAEWTFNKYDAFGRLVISGIYRTGSTHQAMLDTYSPMLFKEAVGSGKFGYTWNTSLPAIPESDVLLVNYYDNYDTMLNTNGYYKTNLAYKPRSGYDTKYANAKGRLVGTRVKLMKPDGTSDNTLEGQIATAMYYDSKGRMIQSQSTNYMGGIDQEYIAYDFSGQPTQRLSIHNVMVNGVSKQQQEMYAYTYDHAGRLTKTTHSLNGGSPVLLAQNTYDELGRLQTTMANNAANTKVSYDYNIRSWTKSISSYHFIENLTYTYSGNIDNQIWKQAGRDNKYVFAYDNLSRIKSATYTGTGRNYTTGYTYDWHGNVLTLNRNGKLDNGTYGLIDNMSFAYTGNQLKKITDSAPNLLSAGSTDFKNGVNAEVEYTFNANGAMIQDLNKGIKSISYNSLNLPRQMVIENQQVKGTNLYTYTATGQKVRVVNQSADTRQLVPVSGTTLTNSAENITTQKDYIGNKIYENGVIKQIQLGNGYIDGGKYYFYIKDHLGNNRIVANASGGVEQSNEYYPFGGLIAENSTNRDKQDFKYNGKEYDSMHGLNQYDYAARHYDPADIRFTTMDPMAEKYYSISPYVYVANNPMKFIDPTGMNLSTDVKKNDDGTYTVTGGKLDGDKNIYVTENGKRTGEVIGQTATETSFYYSEEKSFKGTIDLKDNSGKGFLSKVMDSDLLLDQYMPEGVGGGDYDFKTNGASEKQKNDPNYHYRGMPIANLSDGTVVFSSAREIGNATAGYAAGRAGMDWNDSKMAFGILQGSQEGGFYAKEGLSTVNAERLGWKVGNNEFYSRSIGGRMVRGFEAYPRGVIGVINILYNKLTK